MDRKNTVFLCASEQTRMRDEKLDDGTYLSNVMGHVFVHRCTIVAPIAMVGHVESDVCLIQVCEQVYE